MTRVIFDMSMSLDGFVKASNATPEQPLGEGGERLHEWGFGEDERDRAVLAGGVEGSGAIIAGRRTYNDSLPWWGADGPHPPTQVFVVTHEALLSITQNHPVEGPDRMSELPKVVFSRTLREPLAWDNSRLAKADLVEEVRRLKAESDAPLCTIGSLSVVKASWR
jgi:dihydrofolate reductase